MFVGETTDENNKPGSHNQMDLAKPENDSQSSLDNSQSENQLATPVFQLPETIAALLRAPPPRSLLSNDDWGNDEGDPTTFGFLDFMPSDGLGGSSKDKLYSDNILDQEAPFQPSTIHDDPPSPTRRRKKNPSRFLFCA